VAPAPSQEKEGSFTVSLPELFCWNAIDITHYDDFYVYLYALRRRANHTEFMQYKYTELLQPLESAIQSPFIQSPFIPAITDQPLPGKQVREILALPVRLGGLGLGNPISMAKKQHTASQQISAPLVDRIVHQQHHLGDCNAVQQSTKARFRSRKRTRQKEEAKNLQNQLPSTLQRSMELSQEKGASAWLTSLPIEDCLAQVCI
jgi:hypothetical protein